jgi:hypothetical protein
LLFVATTLPPPALRGPFLCARKRRGFPNLPQ